MADEATHNETIQWGGVPRGAAHCRTVAEKLWCTPPQLLTFLTGPLTSGIVSKLVKVVRILNILVA